MSGGRIVYGDIAPGAAENAVYTGTAVSTSKSDMTQLSDGLINPQLATLELNRWTLDGTREAYSNQRFALISSAVSGADGVFAAAPVLTVTFSDQFSSLGISLRFGSGDEPDYCSHITITWYQGETVLAEREYYPTSNFIFCEQSAIAYDKIVIAFNATPLPYRYVRLERILFGISREFDASELSKADLVQEVNLISAELAINTLDWAFKNAASTDFMFQFKQPVYAYNGENLLGVFYVDTAKKVSGSSYEVSCTDAIGILDNENFPGGVYTGANAVSVMSEIVGGSFELEVDEAFSTATVTGAILPDTKREALQQVAFAIGAVVDTSGTDKISVKKISYDNPATIPQNRIYTGGVVDVESLVTKVVMTWHSYDKASDGSTEINGEKYEETTGTVEIVNPDVTANARSNIVEVTDATLVNESNALEAAQRVYDYYLKRYLMDTKIVVLNEIPGDAITMTTAWGETHTGAIEKMNIKISRIVAAETVSRGTVE